MAGESGLESLNISAAQGSPPRDDAGQPAVASMPLPLLLGLPNEPWSAGTEATETPETATSTPTLLGRHDVEQPHPQPLPQPHPQAPSPPPPPPLPRAADTKRPYSSFTERQKQLIVLCSTCGAMFSPFTTNIYFPALSTIAHDLGVTISLVNLTITTYMIFQAIAPSFMGSFTDSQGRRPAYVVGFVVYVGANLGLALNQSYSGLLVLRCLQSCGSSSLVTLNHATIVDVVTSAERGSYVSITSISSIVAPSVAPVVGGLLSQHLGWHSIFWFLVILSGVYLVPLLLWFPETARQVVGDGSIPAGGWNRSVMDIGRRWWTTSRDDGQAKAEKVGPPGEDQAGVDGVRQRKFTWPNPLPTLAVFREGETCVLLLFAAVAYGAFYAISSSLTVQFHLLYGLNDTLQGLLFLPQAVGSLLSAITNSILLDRNYRRLALKHGFDADRKRQADLTHFPIEAARLQIAMPMFTANGVFMIVYGWMLYAHVHIAGPIVMLVLIGYTTLAGFNALSVLNLDINRHRAASASAAANLARCLFGAGMTAVINPMIEAMGLGWTFTLTGLVELSLVPILWLTMRYGMVWRARRAAGNNPSPVS